MPPLGHLGGLWTPSGVTLLAGLPNAPKWPSGGLLGLLGGLGLEMLQNSSLEASWGYFAGLGPQMLQNGLLEASWGLAVQSL